MHQEASIRVIKTAALRPAWKRRDLTIGPFLKRPPLNLRHQVKSGRVQHPYVAQHSAKSSDPGFWPNALVRDTRCRQSEAREVTDQVCDRLSRCERGF